MADYHSLLARKVAALPQSTPPARQAIYELARKALLNQLRAIQPPVADQVIQNESRLLEEAIARLEKEASAPAAAEPPAPEAPRALGAEAAAPPQTEPERKDGLLRERQRPAAPLPPSPERSPGRRGLLLAGVALILTVVLVALLALHLRESPEDLAKLNPEDAATADAEGGKLSARIGADGKPDVQEAQPTTPVARRAALLIGNKAHPDKPDRIYDGSVMWRLENSGGADGGPVLPAIRGDVDFPEARLKARLLIQKNVDAALPASHTITVTFFIQPDSDFKGVKAIGAPQIRRPESQSGERLMGSMVPTTENSFLMGLMRGDAESRNAALLLAPHLIDIPLQFTDDRLGTINLEKGASGDRVFQDALAAWAR